MPPEANAPTTHPQHNTLGDYSIVGAATNERTQTVQKHLALNGFPHTLDIRLSDSSTGTLSFSTGASPLNLAFSQSSITTGKRAGQGQTPATGQPKGLHPEEHPAIACHAPGMSNPFLDRTVEHLQEALKSGGLVQFVSPAAFHGHQSRDLSIGRYLSMKQGPIDSPPFNLKGLGDVSIQEIESPDPQDPRYPHRVYELSVTDDLQKTETIKIVEIGFSYRDNCFTSDELQKAHEIVKAQFPGNPAGPSTSSSPSLAPRPHIASFGGFGRNAALISLLAAESELNKNPAANVEIVLKSIVDSARRSNPDFLTTQSKSQPSKTQYAEVLDYLIYMQGQLQSQSIPRESSTKGRFSSQSLRGSPTYTTDEIHSEYGDEEHTPASNTKPEKPSHNDSNKNVYGPNSTQHSSSSVVTPKLPIITGATPIQQAVLHLVLGNTAFAEQLNNMLNPKTSSGGNPPTANPPPPLPESPQDSLIMLMDQYRRAAGLKALNQDGDKGSTTANQSIDASTFLQSLDKNSHGVNTAKANTPGEFLQTLIASLPEAARNSLATLTPTFNYQDYVPLPEGSFALESIGIKQLLIVHCNQFGMNSGTYLKRNKLPDGTFTRPAPPPEDKKPFVFDLSDYPHPLKQPGAGPAQTPESSLVSDSYQDPRKVNPYYVDSVITQVKTHSADQFVTYVRSPADKASWIRFSSAENGQPKTLSDYQVDQQLKAEKIHLVGFAPGTQPAKRGNENPEPEKTTRKIHSATGGPGETGVESRRGPFSGFFGRGI